MSIVEFIDNAEDRIVVEIDADWYERRFCAQVVSPAHGLLGHVPDGSLLTHMGLGINWRQTRTEYTGDTYIITIERLWV